MKSTIKIDIETSNNERYCSDDCPQKASSHSCKIFGELDMYIVNYVRDKRCVENEVK